MRLTRSRPHATPDRAEGPAADWSPVAAAAPGTEVPRDVAGDGSASAASAAAPTGGVLTAPAFRRVGARARATESAHADETVAHDVLGAGWAGGGLWTLERAIHPAACLRSGLCVAEGPGSLMASALGDLGWLDDAAYFAEHTLTSATGPDDLCPHALEAMAPDARPGHGAILSLRGSLTGRAAIPDAPDPGPAPRALRLRSMADLWCADGQVRDGWILRDTAVQARAAGMRPADWARARLRAAGGAARLPAPLTPDTDPDGPYVARTPGGRHCDRGEALADRLRRIMDGDLAVLDRGSDPACAHVLPGGEDGLGSAAARRFWAGLRAALPGAAFRIEHRHGATPPQQAPQAAVRWSLYGRHDGTGRFGPPTGCFLHVLGMTQAEFGPRGVRREWTLIDDCAVWTQIVMAAGDT